MMVVVVLVLVVLVVVVVVMVVVVLVVVVVVQRAQLQTSRGACSVSRRIVGLRGWLLWRPRLEQRRARARGKSSHMSPPRRIHKRRRRRRIDYNSLRLSV